MTDVFHSISPGRQVVSAAEIPGVEAADLTNCDQEPIHIIGHIQPYGALLVAREEEQLGAGRRVIQVSESVRELLGLEPEGLIGCKLSELLSGPQSVALASALESNTLEGNPRLVFEGELLGRGPFYGSAHLADGLLLLELEPAETGALPFGAGDSYWLMRETLSRFESATGLDEFCAVIVAEVRRIIGFDRVMVYRFEADGSGIVVAEDLNPERSQSPYLGLRYPASDIPKQARALYLSNALRIIPDSKYRPSPLTPPVADGRQNRATDLSHAFLRGVSMMHVEYLANMGVAASMSLAIVRGGELWGLIACHNLTPKRLSPIQRSACEFLSRVVSLQIAEKETKEGRQSSERSDRVYRELVSSMARETELISGLSGGEVTVRDYIECGGCAVLAEGEVQRIGETPSAEQIALLVDWLQSEQGDSEVYESASLAVAYPKALEYAEVAAGLLALRISAVSRAYVLWFRPEVVQTVNWAGNPSKAKAIPIDEPGNPDAERLHPRKSFEIWHETLYGKAMPWDPREVEAAGRLRTAIADVLLRRVEELSRLNSDLRRSNIELDSFAYIASHDLKEPLRGISNYAHFLREDYADVLDDPGRERIDTLLRLTRRMEGLIDSLLRYSQVGRQQLKLTRCNLSQVVNTIRESMAPTLRAQDAVVSIPRPLPTILCDADQVTEVFSNLIANAVKYNTSAEKRVEIGVAENARPPVDALIRSEEDNENDSGVAAISGRVLEDDSRASHPTVFYVKDNGIGIRARHFASVFRIFKRLHGQGEYGGGSGAGLTIAAKIVQRHGGVIWVESEFGVGSSFFFTLEG